MRSRYKKGYDQAGELASGGSVRRITRWGEPVLHATTRPVTQFDDELHQLIRDMFATLDAAEGVGLAATQVGVDLALFVYDCPDDEFELHRGVFCNPVVELPTGRDRHLESAEEGCLSWPGSYQPLSRPDKAICRGQDAYGNDFELTGTGMLSRCLQHETDHLNGMVFGDRLSARSRRLLDEQKESAAPFYPEDWPITPKGRTDPEPPAE